MVSSACRLVCLSILMLSAQGQIRVMAPEWLKKSLKNKRIEGSTATFGAPFYGDDIVGKLVYGESKGNVHCSEDDYELPEPETEPRGKGQYKAVKLINIAVVRRGKCSFTTKARVAQKKGAHAVIIVDREDSTYTAEDLQRIIVGDDGYGDSVHIPSVLVTKGEGQKLIDAAKKTEAVVELSWTVPSDHIVDVHMWMSSGSTESQQFLKKFSNHRKALNEVMHFMPHYAVFSMPSTDPSVFQDLCSDTTGQYCAEDPDGAGSITGKDVLDEDVRQLCIHEVTKVPKAVRKEIAEAANKDAKKAARASANGKSKGKAAKVVLPQKQKTIVYSEPYWSYVRKLPARCPNDGEAEDARFGKACSTKLMKELDINVDKVETCFSDTYEAKLRDQRDHQAWSPKALRINGWHYKGMLDADNVARAICSGFVNKPAECLDLVSERDPFAKYGEGGVENGVSFNTFVLALAALAVFSCLALFCYKKTLQAQVQSTVREEVMLEVQQAMAQYNRMHGDM